MALLLDRKAIFLHVPKTGGSWVTECADAENLVTDHLGSKHADLRRINEFYRHYPYLYLRKRLSLNWNLTDLIQGCFKFCFVRHPYEWVKSFYRYQTEQGWPNWKGLGSTWSTFGNSNWHPTSWLHGLPHASFNEFVSAILDLRPGFVHELYSWYISDGIDFIGKQESLADDLIEALRRANLTFDADYIRSLDRVNVSEKRPLDADPDLVREFHRVEYPTLLRFGYPIPSDLYAPPS